MTNPCLDLTVGAVLNRAATDPDRDAVVLRERRLSYRALHRAVERCARGLLALGIGPDEKVALWLPNRPEWLVVQHASARIGAVVVALNTRYRAHELGYILAQSDSTTLVLTDHLLDIDFLEILEELIPELREAEPGGLRTDRFSLLRRVICASEDVYPGTLRFQDLLEAGDDPALEPILREREARVRPDDTFTILYTSGTTAFPKGAMITHRNCLPHAWNAGQGLGLTDRDRVLHTLPFSGTWGGVVIPLMVFTHGATLVLEEVFDPLETLHLIQQERITVWNAVDAMLISVLDHPDLATYDTSSLRTGGIAMTGGGRHGLFEEVVERLSMRGAIQPYGMTEVNAMALFPRPDDPLELRARGAGVRPAPGVEARVVDPERGTPLPPGEAGELLIRGFVVTKGYYRKPEETAKAIDAEGWLHTGDLAVQDGSGHTFFLGRLKETLRVGHFMVAPAEIEAYLMSHPAVEQAFVVGVPDPRLAEVPAAFLILKAGAAATEEEILAHCRGKIAGYKIPRYVRFVTDVPRTPGPHGDKVQRAKLREQAVRELGLADGQLPGA